MTPIPLRSTILPGIILVSQIIKSTSTLYYHMRQANVYAFYTSRTLFQINSSKTGSCATFRKLENIFELICTHFILPLIGSFLQKPINLVSRLV